MDASVARLTSQSACPLKFRPPPAPKHNPLRASPSRARPLPPNASPSRNQIHKPLRSKHDRFSNRCVARYDHYCPWVYNVVGLKNHRMFVIYLTFSLILQGLYATLAFICASAWSGPRQGEGQGPTQDEGQGREGRGKAGAGTGREGAGKGGAWRAGANT